MCPRNTEFYCAGYQLTKFVPRQSARSAALLPDRIISLSECISPFLPESWLLEWAHEENRAAMAAVWGLEGDSLKSLMKWAGANLDKEFGWPNIGFSLETVRFIKREFLQDSPEALVIGIGLHRSYADRLLDITKIPPQKPGYAPEGDTGLHTMVARREHMAEGGTILGFEPASVGDLGRTIECSWLCNGLETDVQKELGISPNTNGLIQTFKDARTKSTNHAKDFRKIFVTKHQILLLNYLFYIIFFYQKAYPA